MHASDVTSIIGMSKGAIERRSYSPRPAVGLRRGESAGLLALRVVGIGIDGV